MSRDCSSMLSTHLIIQVKRCLQAGGKDGRGEAIVNACVLVIALGPQLIRGCLHRYTYMCFTYRESGCKHSHRTTHERGLAVQNCCNEARCAKSGKRSTRVQRFRKYWKGKYTPEAPHMQSRKWQILQAPTTQTCIRILMILSKVALLSAACGYTLRCVKYRNSRC